VYLQLLEEIKLYIVGKNYCIDDRATCLFSSINMNHSLCDLLATQSELLRPILIHQVIPSINTLKTNLLNIKKFHIPMVTVQFVES